MAQKKIRWGIIGTARIAETAFIPAMAQTRRGEIVAIASRNRDRAKAFAGKHQIPEFYEGYANLLANDEIDAIYNPLPNTLHPEWTKLAAQHGKHIFCEKPLAVTAAEAEEMVRFCQEAGVLLFDAFVFLYHPQTLKLRQMLDDGVIGDLLQTQAHISFHLARPSENIRWNRDLGGGSLLDAGAYPITFTRFAFGTEPVSIQSARHIEPNSGVDSRAAILLSFAGDRYGTVQASFDAMGGPGAFLHGERGHIIVPQPYHPAAQSHFQVYTAQGVETVEFDTGVLPFAPAIEHFHDCLLDGAEPMCTADYAAGTIRIIEAILA